MAAVAGVDSCGKTCDADIDNQWLGVSLSRQGSDGSVLVRTAGSLSPPSAPISLQHHLTVFSRFLLGH